MKDNSGPTPGQHEVKTSTITIRGTETERTRSRSLVFTIAARNALHCEGRDIPMIHVCCSYFAPSVSSRAGAGYLKENLTDNAGNTLVQDLTHHQVEQPALVLHKQGLVVLVSGQVVQGVGGSPQHVQAGPHGVWIVSQCVHSVLLSNYQRVGLSLLDEANEKADCVVLQGDGSGHA